MIGAMVAAAAVMAQARPAGYLPVSRIIRVATNPGDVVVDPFAGSGTTLAAAKKLGRKYLGTELSEQYADGVRKRLQMIEFAETTDEQVRKREAVKR